MKLLVVTQFYYPEPFRVHEICEELVKEGHQVTVVTTLPNYPEGEIYANYQGKKNVVENINGVEVIRYYSIPRHKGAKNLAISYISFALRASLKIRQLRKRSFDAIYVYQMSPVSMALPAIRLKNTCSIPMYLYCLDIWPESIKDFISEENSFLFRVVHLLSKYIYQKADMIGITSKVFEDYLSEKCGIDRNKIRLLYQHAETIEICPKDDRYENTNLFYMGNIGEAQNIDLILEAVKQIKDIPGFSMNFVGAGSRLEYAKEKTEKLGLNDIVVFHGRHPASEMSKYYKMADACILTLRNQDITGLTIPGKMQGYMSAGKTILASINGESAEIINNEGCGIAVKADDASAFAEVLKEFVTHKNRYLECGNYSRKYFELHFTLEKHISNLVLQINEMIQKVH